MAPKQKIKTSEKEMKFRQDNADGEKLNLIGLIYVRVQPASLMFMLINRSLNFQRFLCDFNSLIKINYSGNDKNDLLI